MSATCHRCGGDKRDALDVCDACGHQPGPTERGIAWLFSDEHLSEVEREEAAQRLRGGERADPSRALLAYARHRAGAPALPEAGLTPLRSGQLAVLTAANLLLTPLAGAAVWWGLRQDRPRAARQALWATLPAALFTTGIWAAVLLVS